jgi:hypothetical protein
MFIPDARRQMKRTVLTGALISVVVFGLATTSGWAGPIQHPDAVSSKWGVTGISFTQLAQALLGQDEEYDEENACREEIEKADEARHWRDGHLPNAKDRTFVLAGRLTAEETIVGIRSEQLDAWRNYSSALLAFADRFPPRLKGETAPGNAGDDPAKSRDTAPLTTDIMADIAIERGVRAQALKEATNALLNVLTPEQRVKFADADRKSPWASHRLPGAE